MKKREIGLVRLHSSRSGGDFKGEREREFEAGARDCNLETREISSCCRQKRTREIAFAGSEAAGGDSLAKGKGDYRNAIVEGGLELCCSQDRHI